MSKLLTREVCDRARRLAAKLNKAGGGLVRVCPAEIGFEDDDAPPLTIVPDHKLRLWGIEAELYDLATAPARIAREEGVIVRGIRDLIALSPPFTITREELDLLFTAVGRTLERLWD